MEPIFVLNEKVFTAQAMTSTVYSPSVDIAECAGFAVHSIWTGTPVGNIIIGGSDDNVNFAPVSTTAVGGASGQSLVNLDGQHYRYIQVEYSFTSGTGSLTSYVSGKRK